MECCLEWIGQKRPVSLLLLFLRFASLDSVRKGKDMQLQAFFEASDQTPSNLKISYFH